MQELYVYNTLSRRKERFEPQHPPFVGMYVCGPTVYGEGHLGHARSAITFDIVFRYLRALGYQVRYVRNITDVGHLENDADEGEDKIAKKARLEQLEPMEVAQHYTNQYRAAMQLLNVLPPSIEPQATGHIPEQIRMVEQIIRNGFAYEANGSVYFDVAAYAARYPYGLLSGRSVEELLAGSRENLAGQAEKRSPADFALWKRADPEHIMRWDSPWGVGFPGWHIECSAMSTKYLGEVADIHGGGMDLLFPHHEAEIAQSNACANHAQGMHEARYWLHNNMITINGQKMGKSLGNFITLSQFFTGDHPALAQAYSPMTIRFFILQGHYRSTLDFGNEALQAAEKGYKRLMHAIGLVPGLPISPDTTLDLDGLAQRLEDAMCDDFNTAITIAELFDACSLIHKVESRELRITEADRARLAALLKHYAEDILGLAPELPSQSQPLQAAMQVLIDLRNQARREKNWPLSDAIRDQLATAGIQLLDKPEGTQWTLNP
ncbi:MAG: cysteine--tRNA ligase [Bacteroidetes bacterium]|jgi:cysteinyl-tRNA synthetase|nr:cysteine--tRNA ligase [Bacteroidota bacterium]